MWNDATSIKSTWRSGEFRGYCDLHRRGIEPWAGFSADRASRDVAELLGVRLTIEGEGDSRGKPLDLKELRFDPVVERERLELSEGLCGKVTFMMGEDQRIAPERSKMVIA